jgi:hypothetical protein
MEGGSVVARMVFFHPGETRTSTTVLVLFLSFLFGSYQQTEGWLEVALYFCLKCTGVEPSYSSLTPELGAYQGCRQKSTMSV